MPYAAQISRTNPACILLLVDQSKSMDEPFGGQPDLTKSAVVADAINRLLQNLVLRCAKADGVRDYFHVGVVGYGHSIVSGLGGRVPFEVLVPISRLSDRPLRVETRTKLVPDGAGGVLEQTVRFPVWLEAKANGQTPLCEALSAATLAVKGFVDQYPRAYPPIVAEPDRRPAQRRRPAGQRPHPPRPRHRRRRRAALQPAPERHRHRADLLPRRRAPARGQERPVAVPDGERAAAAALGGGAGGGVPGGRRGPRRGVQRRPDRGRPVPRHRHPRDPGAAPSAARRLAWASATLPKANALAGENEDAVAAAPPRGRFAVADGASEGWQSGAWARHLAAAYVARPPAPQDFPRWLAAVRDAWRPPEQGPAAWYADVKREQGSFATLLGVQFAPGKAGGGLTWKAVAVGDSCLFVVRGGAVAASFPVEGAEAFGNRPPLVPSAAGRACPEPEWLAGRAEPGDLFVLATDAAAAGLFARGGPDLWPALRAAAEGGPAARPGRLLELAREFQGLQNDDVSLVVVAVPAAAGGGPPA